MNKQPSHFAPSFTCPFCKINSKIDWYISSNRGFEDITIGKCTHCNKDTIWLKKKLIYPSFSPVQQPHKDMPASVKEYYCEAADIVYKSSRAACAMLRLAVQQLCIELGLTGKNLNTDISYLVSMGLPVHTQQALDIVRVIGNNAVHPGHISYFDDESTARALFSLVNHIVEKMISEPKEIGSLFSLLPKDVVDQIKSRDKKMAEKSKLIIKN